MTTDSRERVPKSRSRNGEGRHHILVKAFVALAALALIGFVVYQMSEKDPLVVATVLSALAAVLGAMAVMIRSLRDR